MIDRFKTFMKSTLFQAEGSPDQNYRSNDTNNTRDKKRLEKNSDFTNYTILKLLTLFRDVAIEGLL